MLPRRRTMLVVAALSAALLSGCASAGTAGVPEPAEAEALAPGAAGRIQDPVLTDAKQTSTATATRVEIPAIGVSSALEQLPLDAAGVLTPPVEWQAAGWYKDGVVPGEVGPAVIAGHVDSNAGPAVFFRLGDLAPGALVHVTLSTGEVVTYAVDRTTTAPKNAFPTALVYGPTPDSQLRLITCDGDFDRSTGHYEDNLIVFATAVPA